MKYFKLLLMFLLTIKTLGAVTTCQSPIDGLIGVTDVEISNKTARLVFNESGIQSQASVALKETSCFNVLD
ncbi:MAG: hypothetical protein U9N59_06015 [Campylobacterota bacterium]|nr:hypothetical protein [Campylobacterota bacterium]